jgi:3-deoxy-D-arabino-heptulosonate 7-phosphate (DAHP) synthase
MAVILELGRLRQKDSRFKTSLSYIMRVYLKKTTTNKIHLPFQEDH